MGTEFMQGDVFTGQWVLAGVAEIDATGESSGATGVEAWLNGSGEPHVVDAMAASGLLLTVIAEGRFTERPEAAPSDGYLQDQAQIETASPVEGVLTSSGPVRYLRPQAITAWAVPAQENTGSTALFFEDGGTKIADSIQISGSQLIRTVNMAAADGHLTRLVLIYVRK